MTSPADLADRVDRLVEEIDTRRIAGRRTIVALAGPPAAGKSTLASALVERLGDRAALLGLDGFHFDNDILVARGHRDRKGAPHTFDTAGYRATLVRVRDQPDSQIAVPVFDRGQELSRAGAAIIEPHHTVVVTEGNWLLLDLAPWSDLGPLFDLSVMVRVDETTVAARIRQRWRDHGLDAVQADRRAELNDLPNARLVLTASRTADIDI